MHRITQYIPKPFVFRQCVELFNNPALWSKKAIFNQREDDDYSDLKQLITLINWSETSLQDFSKLKDLADIEVWAQFDALQTMLQSWHNDDEHNMRIISDVWRGKIFPIVYEVKVDVSPKANLIFENPQHSLFKIFTKSSEFLSIKYNYLYSYLNQGILTKASDHVYEIKEEFKHSWSRDVHHDWNRTNTKRVANIDIAADWDQFSENLILRETFLLSILNQPPQSSWQYGNKILSISVNGVVPLSNAVFVLEEFFQEKPPKVYFDKDNNGKISKGDLLIPSIVKGKNLQLNADFFANRVSFKGSYNEYPKEQIVNTVFNLIIDMDLKISNGYSNQYFNGKEHNLQKSVSLGQTPSSFNIPIVDKLEKVKKDLSVSFFSLNWSFDISPIVCW